NRLIAATNATESVSYTYDYQGRMVEKTVNSAPTRYLWDGFNIIAEIGANETRYNIWGLDLSQTPQGAGGVGGLLAVAVAGGADPGIFYPAYDANGNISEYVDAAGDVIASRSYSPFGETTAATGNADAFSHWWSTKPWDPVTGFSEYEFRMYNPGLGRWLSRDPIGEGGGVHLYAYVFNSPIQGLDALGLSTQGVRP
ncbi:MAG: RHS repeat-associated core domain-containing protein, partial [Candidatus Hydrogenedentes bacterium]|nr:RHS repeat-associated core domain-containing protein [Candidatus Hydrogenedentota bacterium]